MKKVVTFILGTARKGRRSEHVARFVLECAKKRGDIEVLFIDVRDYAQDQTRDTAQAKARPWQEIAQKSDGFVIVSPEYNHGYPGELKMLLDNAYKEYKDKPFAICGVSIGSLGGARMAEGLKLVIAAFQAIIINNIVHFGPVEKIFDESGRCLDVPTWEKRVNAMLDALVEYL